MYRRMCRAAVHRTGCLRDAPQANSLEMIQQHAVREMHVISELSGSTGTAYPVITGAQLAKLGWQASGEDLSIHQQADQVLAHKQARDLSEAWCAARECGCRQCRQVYRMTCGFYDTLGLSPPALERISTPD